MVSFDETNPDGVDAAELVVGIPSLNEADTIGSVVEVLDDGLRTHFPGLEAVIVNADNASPDGTREAFLATRTRTPKIYLTTPAGVRGKGNNLLNLFRKAEALGARALVTVDADLRSIERRWVQKLGNPILKGFDLVTPIYLRHKYDGTITNNIAYPVISAVFGHRLRQPIGGEFGLSRKAIELLLSQPVGAAVRSFGIDIWITAQACAHELRVCQSFMDAPKVHRPKDPGRGLDTMFLQVTDVLFALMAQRPEAWMTRERTAPSIVFGFGMGARQRPPAVTVNTGNLHRQFKAALHDHPEDYRQVLGPEQWAGIRRAIEGDPFDLHIPRKLWARIVYDFAVAHARATLPRDHLLRLLLALYKGKVLSDLLYLTEKGAWLAERHVEVQVDRFEHEKPYLLQRWREDGREPAG